MFVLGVSGETTVTAVGAATLLTVSISYALNSARRAREEIKDLRHDNTMCNWRQTVMAETMHAAGIPVPHWIWGDAPDGVNKMSQEEQRSLAQKMIDPFDDQSDGVE